MAAGPEPDKRALRRFFLEARLALGEEAARLGAAAEEVLAGHEVFRRARSILIYLPFRGEVPTALIAETARRRGKVVAAPVTLVAPRRLRPYRLTGRPGELRVGAYGILEPDPSVSAPIPPEEVDLVVVPGVAFDLEGGRLGYGGGYYDRFLEVDAPRATRAGLAFEVQIASRPLPLGSDDARMDFVFTEKRIIRSARETGGSPPASPAGEGRMTP